ncbi:inositol phosphorylceramide synthase [Thermoleophilia bacterium SCSIO 60948]|nr:inositol phosphorylceramide synthase [Thermoleophilia bacterium SCSIO 60948]
MAEPKPSTAEPIAVGPAPVTESRGFFSNPEYRAVMAPLSVAAVSLILLLVSSFVLGLPIRDPDAKYVGSPLGLIGLICLVFIAVDVIPRGVSAARRSRTALGSRLKAVPGESWRILRERWATKRGIYAALGLIAFYVTYVSYRNLKSFLPFVRGDEVDASLLQLDRAMFFGQDPGPFLHSILGTGITPQILSFVYIGFLSFVPLSLGAALIWSTKIRTGLWYVTALCLAWLLGAASYYMIPSLGPAYAAPSMFADLPVTEVTKLQYVLLENRLEVIYDPQTSGAVQSVAAFASLHVAVILLAALIAQAALKSRVVKIVMWVFFALTCLATIYFGWHYLIDDIAGLIIGFLAVYIGGRMTGQDWRPYRSWKRRREARAAAA